VLVEFARRLELAVDDSHMVARWGGDEFIVLVREVADAAALYTLGEHVGRRSPAPVVGRRSCDASTVSKCRSRRPTHHERWDGTATRTA
jgi:GGDEF domain-containing protein